MSPKQLFAPSFFALFVSAFGPSVAHAQIASLGRGLDQMVQMYENANPKLATVLKPHITAPSGELLVEIHLQPGVTSAQVMPQLNAAGFKLQTISRIDPRWIEGYLPLSAVRSTSWVPGIQVISSVERPIHAAGQVPSQAVPVEKADVAQAHGFDGTGTKVGILSVSFANVTTPSYQDDVAIGALPPDVFILQDFPATPTDFGDDEGRAMAQLVYDIAPGAKLGFATAALGQGSFSNNILGLREVFGADVIVDDEYYFAEPFYSDGLLSKTVDAVVAEGAAYYSSAGNNGLEAYEDVYHPISFADAQELVAEGKSNLNLAALVAAGHTPVSFHVFGGHGKNATFTQLYSSAANNIVSFQWDEPFFLGKVKTNFDIYVFDQNGNYLDPDDPNFPGFYTTDDNTVTDEPYEYLFLPPYPGDIHGAANVTNYQLVIANVNDGPARHIKYINLNGLADSERQNAPSTFGHATARNGQGVAAMYYAITRFPEDFSSPGPATFYIDDNGDRFRQPEVRYVPQITGIDGVDNTLLGGDTDGDGWPNFFGTSAAAPDVAAVAALVIQAAGGPGKIAPKDVYGIIQRTATPVWLSRNRALSGTVAGPVVTSAQEDWTRLGRYFTLGVLPCGNKSVTSVTYAVGNTGLLYSLNPNRFSIEFSNGLPPASVSYSVSPDQTSITLSFAPGTFTAGESFTFGTSIFSPLQGSTQEDADRMEGLQVTATLSDGSTFEGTFQVAPKTPYNNFTGAGLVNAELATDLATRSRRHHH
jgi:hypothetical protein